MTLRTTHHAWFFGLLGLFALASCTQQEARQDTDGDGPGDPVSRTTPASACNTDGSSALHQLETETPSSETETRREREAPDSAVATPIGDLSKYQEVTGWEVRSHEGALHVSVVLDSATTAIRARDIASGVLENLHAARRKEGSGRILIATGAPSFRVIAVGQVGAGGSAIAWREMRCRTEDPAR